MWVRQSSNGRMGTSAPTPSCDRPRRGRCPQRPVDNGCTPVVPLIRHGCAMPPSPLRGEGFGRSVRSAQISMAFPSSVMGLRPCHLPPCVGKAMFVLMRGLTALRPSPHPSRLTPCHLPPGEGLGRGAGIPPSRLRRASFSTGEATGASSIAVLTCLPLWGRCPRRGRRGPSAYSSPGLPPGAPAGPLPRPGRRRRRRGRLAPPSRSGPG